MDTLVRRALPGDSEAINDIYNFYVLYSTCTFQAEPEPLDGRAKWLQAHDDRYPAFVAEASGQVLGWASLSQYHRRYAYRFTIENSVYVRHDMRGRGIGSQLMQRLIEEGGRLGYHSIVAVIAADQAESIAFHEKHGFREVAHLRELGHKFGSWIDIRMYQLML